jgi:hypothetical protein
MRYGTVFPGNRQQPCAAEESLIRHGKDALRQ